MNDLNCPYCDTELEVNHDDGFGYEEDAEHEMQCPECEKNFVFYTAVHYHYTPRKADCLNGAEHDMRRVNTAAWPDWKRCSVCGHEERGRYVGRIG